MSQTLFVTSALPQAGRTYATGWLGRQLTLDGHKVATMKLIAPGAIRIDAASQGSDIITHRRIMGTPLTADDRDGVSSPQPIEGTLPPMLEGIDLEFKGIDRSTRRLRRHCDTLLIEDTFGLMAPLAHGISTIDYVQNRNFPIALVVDARPGSLESALALLEIIKRRNMRLGALLFSERYNSEYSQGAEPTYRYISKLVASRFNEVHIERIPIINPDALAPVKLPEAEAPRRQITISKLQLAEMPTVTFPGTINVIEHRTQALEAIAWLKRQKIVGFDTETRPSFRKGRVNNPSLVQISTPRRCFLFRLNKLGFIPELREFMESKKVKKIGLSLKDDFHALCRIDPEFKPEGFIDLQDYVPRFDIIDASLQKIYGIIFGKRISKNQRLSNWEAAQLSEAQQIYGAIDAWASLRIYTHLENGKFDPATSPYIKSDEADSDDFAL